MTKAEANEEAQLKEKAKEFFGTALPFLLRANCSRPNDKETLRSLRDCLARTENDDLFVAASQNFKRAEQGENGLLAVSDCSFLDSVDESPSNQTSPQQNSQGSSTDATNQSSTEPEILGSGSSVLIDSKNGCLVTNAHVVEGASYVFIGNKNIEFVPARIVAKRNDLDLAILMLEDPSAFSLLPSAVVRSEVDQGEDVTAIGYPKPSDLGLSVKMTAGIISAPEFLNQNHMLQIDAAITGGNSGGGLFDADGYLVGIPSNGYRPDTDTENINGAIKAGFILDVAASTPCNVSKSRNFSVSQTRQKCAVSVLAVLAVK